MSIAYKSSPSIPHYLQQVFAEKPRREVFANGLTLLTKDIPGCGLASVQYWVKTGSIHESQWLGSGVSHYLEHMLFKGTKNRPGNLVAEEIQTAGGYLNAYTSFDRTVYYADGPSEIVPVAIDALGDMVFNATLNEEDCIAEKDVILREIDMGLDDPDNELAHGVFRLAFNQSPMRFPIIGERQLFSALTHEDLRAYYQSRYQPGNTVLVIAGDFDLEAVREQLTKLTEEQPARSCAPVLVPAEKQQLASRSKRLFADVQIVRGSVAYRVPGLTHELSPALDILASILGHGRSSRLWRKLHDQEQLVSYIDASCWNPGTDGLFWISYNCEPSKREATEQAINAICEEVANNGITEAELQRARQQASVSEVNSRKTVSGQASRIGMAEVVIGDGDYPQHYFNKLFALEAADIQRAAAKFLTTSRLNRVSLEPQPSSTPAVLGSTHKGWPDFEEKQLSNGARLIWQPVKGLPKVHLRTTMLGGPIYEAAGQRGACHLLATLLCRDTQQRDYAAVAERVEAAGASFSSFCGNNSFGLGLEMLTGDADLLLDVWKEALLKHKLTPGTLDRERASQIAAILEDEDDVVTFARRKLRQLAFGSHPFATGPDGNAADLRTLPLEAIAALAKQLIVPENIVVAISGEFQAESLLPAIEEALLTLPASNFSAQPTDFRNALQTGAEQVTVKREQSVVFHAYPDVGVNDEQYVAGEVLDEIFSEMSGRLFDEVRNKRGLAYFVGASRLSAPQSGLFNLYAGTHPGAAEEVLTIFEAEVARVAAGQLTQPERDRAITRLKAQKRMTMQTSGARAMQASLNVLYGQTANHWRAHEAKLEAVDLQALQAFAQQYLTPDKRFALTVGP